MKEPIRRDELWEEVERTSALWTASIGVMLNSRTPDAERERLAHELREYCKLDTLAMVRVAQRLERAAG